MVLACGAWYTFTNPNPNLSSSTESYFGLGFYLVGGHNMLHPLSGHESSSKVQHEIYPHLFNLFTMCCVGFQVCRKREPENSFFFRFKGSVDARMSMLAPFGTPLKRTAYDFE